MKRETIPFTTEEDWLNNRALDITSTEISALFDCCPYVTKFELWHRKRHKQRVDIQTTERMKWGSRLEAAIAKGVCDDNNWMGRPFKSYARLPEHRLGSSFDYIADMGINLTYDPVVTLLNGVPKRADVALLEIKNVDSLVFKSDWIEDGKGSYEAPPHIEFQVQHQMLVSGIHESYIVAMVGGNTMHLLHRTLDGKIANMILRKSAEFWSTVDGNQEPSPDFNRDADAVISMHQYSEPDKVIEADENISNLAKGYIDAHKDFSAAESRKKALKAEIMTLIGDAEKVILPFGSITAGMIGPTRVEAYDRAGYRNFRVNERKQK